MGGTPLVISHRTQAGTMPENTLAGIDAALAAGVDGVEIDVRATSDGVPVLLHDASLERTAGDAREVSSLTLAELRAVAPDVPTLAQALERVALRAILVIEVKQSDVHAQVARAVRAARADACCWIWAFHPAVGAACRHVLPEVPVGLNVAPGSLERYGYADEPVALAVRNGFAAVSWEHRMVDEGLVRSAQRRGLSTYCWTPDEPQDIKRVFEAGVDAICSNFPDRVNAAIGREPHHRASAAAAG